MPAADPGLSQTDLRRLEKPAKCAGRTLRAMLKFVLRDGFAETERVVGAVQAGRADVAAGRIRTHVAQPFKPGVPFSTPKICNTAKSSTAG